MSVRRNPITGEPVLFAPARAARPGAFGAPDEGDRCPFCPGHEADTPPTLASVGTPWRIRAFANKYPPAEGAEVIVESPRHDATFATIDHAAECVLFYRERYRAHQDAAYAALFRNEGTAAGSSIDHLHSQLVPLPFVPPRVARERDAFAAAPHCPLCDANAGVLIDETSSFRRVAPEGSSMPYQQWVIPRRHVPDFGDLRERELEELGTELQRAASATRRIAAAWNWAFLTFRGAASAHFYVELLPRMSMIAGLELGSGTFVEMISPSDAAMRLRD